MTEKPRKHVIFLGAGASARSGYPQANRLRLLLSSRSHFETLMKEVLVPADPNGTEMTYVMQMFQSNIEPIMLFRNGAFASVDEFCKVAATSKPHKKALNAMRSLTRFVLGAKNPELNFEESDYYPFVQRLFDDSLRALRSEITVISFNYDVYLEHILLRAFSQRNFWNEGEVDAAVANRLTGGFYQLNQWKANDAGFVLLKLHGSIACPRDPAAGYYDFFAENPAGNRLSRLRSCPSPPAIVFPWELFDGDFNFMRHITFPDVGDSSLFGAFEASWKRAQEEVELADKFSFVGLAMHRFLEQGFKFLFMRRKTPAREIVVANPDAEISDKAGVANSYTRTMQMLNRVAPKMMAQKTADGTPALKPPYKTRVRANFAEFIEHEMG